LDNGQRLEKKEKIFRLALGIIEIALGCFALLSLIMLLANHPHIQAPLIYLVDLPYAVALPVCGVGVLNWNKQVWPIYLSWVVGLITIIIGVEFLIRGLSSTDNDGHLFLVADLIAFATYLLLGSTIIFLAFVLRRYRSTRLESVGFEEVEHEI